MKSDKKFVLIYGFGYSGSGAVLDMLKEYEGVYVNKAFFSIIKNPYGIIDLESSLIDNWDFVKASHAIEDFKWLCSHSSKPSTNYLIPAGLDLKSKVNRNFLKLVDDYCSELITFRYKCWNEVSDFKTPYYRNMINRFLRIISRKTKFNIDPDDLMNFVSIDKEHFYKITQNFINKLFEFYYKEDFIVLDHHPLPVQFADKLNSYFGENAKMIVVDRDPRGIYYDLVTHNNRLGQELAKSHNWKLYTEWHKQLRRKLPKGKNIMYLKFEDLIFDYEKSESEIASFLGLDANKHVYKYKHFDPKISIRNINLWRNNDSNIPNDIFENLQLELNNIIN